MEELKRTKRQERLIKDLLKYSNSGRIVTELEIDEYLSFQTNGGQISGNNILLDCQKWKEWTITSLIEEVFEWWCDNAGWIYPLNHILHTEKDKKSVNVKAVTKIIKNIETVGVLEFYLGHEGTNKDPVYLNKMLDRKYGTT